jgi:tetratricopeptide (TPR) repeat protein
MSQVSIDQAMKIAFQHHQAGRLRDAEVVYRQVLAQQPAHASALQHLGLIAHQVGRNEIAVDLIQRAIALDPNSPDAYSNLGKVLKDMGQLDEAIAACRGAIGMNPGLPEPWSNLGNALCEKGQLDDAVAAYRQAIALRPAYAEAYSNLGNALNKKGQYDDAIIACRRAIALRPGFVDATVNLGAALANNGVFDEAIAAYRLAIVLDPQLPKPHWNLALALLATGDFERGWEEYEWRWKVKEFPSRPPNFSQPLWDGRPMNGRTILLHAEQGLGDTLQFIRYLPLVQSRGGKPIVLCQPELERLLRTQARGWPVVAKGQPLPDFELHCPVASLPRAFGTTPRSIPSEVPYLFPDPELLESWRQKLAGGITGPRVALAWAGNPNFSWDRTRSITLDRLAPLAEVRGVTFYSLQKGESQSQTGHPPPGLRLADLGPELHDFADTAAALCLMDLVITTDTSVAHLAGALGRPVWLMLQFVPDWRWFPRREDSAWYPSMRLMRQPSKGDWGSVIRRVADELSHWTPQ